MYRLNNADEHFYRKVTQIAIPISLQSMITVGINLLDTMMLSHMGDAQLSASSLAGQFVSLFQICCMGIGMGASVLTSRFWGMKDKNSLRQTITIMLRLCFALSLTFTLAVTLLPDEIMHLYTKDAEILSYGCTYLTYMIPTFFCMGITMTCTGILRSTGETFIPLLSSIAAFFINIFFNWMFIFGKLGAPRMEIAGAALGTLLSRLVELAFIGGYFFLIDKSIGYRIYHILLRCKNLTREYFRICIPVLISDSLLALGNTLVAVIMGHIGRTFVAANSVTSVVQQLCSVFTQGIAHAACIMTGHVMGEGNIEKAKKQGFAFLHLGFTLGCIASVLILFLKSPIINYYEVSESTKAIAYELMNAIGITIVFQSTNSILTKGVLRGGGDTKFLMAGDILFLWIASIPLGALSGLLFHWPAFWIYFMLRIDQILKCIWCYSRLRSGKWLKYISPAFK